MRAEEDDPLLHAHTGGRGGFNWLLVRRLALLISLNPAMALYLSWEDAAAVPFEFLYTGLVVLFCCLRLFERADPGSAARRRLRMANWLLATALTVAFTYKVAAFMPITLELVVCAMASATVLGDFYALFLHRKRKKGLLAALGGAASPRPIADTGASHHAVGDCRLLCGLTLYSDPDFTTLPNGSRLRILGVGRIDLGDFRVPNVYLVDGFQKCLISMSQLDRDHGLHSSFGRGIGRIMMADGTQVGGAFLDNDGMYVLRYLEVPSPAQE